MWWGRRSTDELTSYTGYGGAKRNFKGDKLCYHNMRGIGDYGKAGAGEVLYLFASFLAFQVPVFCAVCGVCFVPCAVSRVFVFFSPLSPLPRLCTFY